MGSSKVALICRAAVTHHSAGVGEEHVGGCVPLDNNRGRCRPRVIMFGQAINLIDAEDGVSLEKWDVAFDVIAIAVSFGPCEATGIDDGGARLASAHVATELSGLLESHPDRRSKALRNRFGPEKNDVHATVG